MARKTTKANTIDKPLLTSIYIPKEDKTVYVYRTKLFLLCPVPYVWKLDLKTIDKIKMRWQN